MMKVCPADEMIFKRTPSQIGRNVELCHPPKFLDKVQRIFKALREEEQDKFEMWFKSESRGQVCPCDLCGGAG